MATVSSRNVAVLDGIYATPTGIRLGTARSKVQPVGPVLGSMDKPSARRLRKALRRAGFRGHAAATAVSG